MLPKCCFKVKKSVDLVHNLKIQIMKNIFLLLSVLFFSVASFAQQERKTSLNKQTKMIDVVYYHYNGVVSQTGSYTLDGKLNGDWLSYDVNGEKIVSAVYDHGKKVGKWFYWTDKTLKEVDYSNNAIVNVTEWEDKTSVAVKN